MPTDNNELTIKDKTSDGIDSQFTDLDEFWRIFFGRIHVIMAITIAGFIGASLYYFHLPNVYIAASKILVERPESKEKINNNIMQTGALREEDYFGTQIFLITGKRITDIVNSELGKIPCTYQVNAKRIRSTRILVISVESTNGLWAAKIANKYSEVYVRESFQEGQFVQQQILDLLPSETGIMSGEKSDQIGEFSKKEFAGSLQSISMDPVLSSLKKDRMSVEAQISELSQRYKSQHPMIKGLTEKLNYLNNQITEKTQKVLGNVRANLAGTIKISNIKVLEEALPARSPSKPNRPMGIISGTFMSFVFGVLMIFMMEYTNQKIVTEHDISQHVGLPFLGYIPLVKEIIKNKKGGRLEPSSLIPSISGIEILKKNSMLADAVANVRTHILFSIPYEKSKRIMIVSSIPDEGKSTVASLFALSLASLNKKILLIDADLRRPFLHTYFNISHGKGLTDYLVGMATLDEIMIDVPGTELKIISGGSVSPNPSELLASEAFRDLMDRVADNFDRVVVDVPPVLYIPDGMIVARLAHCSVLVCGAKMVDKKAAKTVKEKFDQIHQPLLGVIINKVNYQQEGYKYKYYKSYHKYYSRRGKKS